jgi:hypothetical protein
VAAAENLRGKVLRGAAEGLEPLARRALGQPEVRDLHLVWVGVFGLGLVKLIGRREVRRSGRCPCLLLSATLDRHCFVSLTSTSESRCTSRMFSGFRSLYVRGVPSPPKNGGRRRDLISTKIRVWRASAWQTCTTTASSSSFPHETRTSLFPLPKKKTNDNCGTAHHAPVDNVAGVEVLHGLQDVAHQLPG